MTIILSRAGEDGAACSVAASLAGSVLSDAAPFVTVSFTSDASPSGRVDVTSAESATAGKATARGIASSAMLSRLGKLRVRERDWEVDFLITRFGKEGTNCNP